MDHLSATDHRPCLSEMVWIHLSLTKQKKLIMESEYCESINTRGVVDDVSLQRMLRSIEGLITKVFQDYRDKVTKENKILCYIPINYIQVNQIEIHIDGQTERYIDK